MEFIRNALRDTPEFGTLLSAIKHNRLPLVASGLSRIHKANIIDTLRGSLSKRAVIVMPDEAEATKLQEDLLALGTKALFFPARDLVFRQVEGISREYEHLRIGVLCKMLTGDYEAVITTIDAASIFTVPPKTLQERYFVLKLGDKIPLQAVTQKLVSCGYVRKSEVEGVGQFAVRGGILDLFTPDKALPVRIEFWGDDIDSISSFETVTQRRQENLDEISISPALEVLFDSNEELITKITKFSAKVKNEETKKLLQADIARLSDSRHLPSLDKYLPLCYSESATFFDYIDNSLLFVSENAKIKERMRTFSWQQAEDMKALFEDNVLCKGLDVFALDYAHCLHKFEKMGATFLEVFSASSSPIKLVELIHFNLKSMSVWNGTLEMLIEDIEPALHKNYKCVVLGGTERAAKVLASDLIKEGISASYMPQVNELQKNHVIVTAGGLSAGIDYPSAATAIFTHGRATTNTKKKHTPKNKGISSIGEITKGDYVVHTIHGIGLFDGINKIETQGIIKDYIRIKYAKEDVLYVPVTQLDLVSKYIGAGEDGGVKLHRLGGTEWQKTKTRVRSAVKDMAKQLIALYAERMQIKGFAFSEDTDMQSDFERRFEYDETDDQLRCVEEIKVDMQRSMPMDRLLCGDVGFGKTEVALRAAFKCISEGKQCALLVPTTILAWQHYQTILKRMEGMPIKAEMISRFRTPRQQEAILKELKRGNIDLIVGTHRLISKDIVFKDLGLLIIDEEQRFGVAQKEKLKELFPVIDVLTLSATPIPRTLNMAMAGLRDMSVIEEAPGDRHPVQTYVLEYDKGIIVDAIKKELRRGGQAYVIHNRVESIDRVAAKLSLEIPDAKIGTAHGKMSEEQLSDVWKKLIDNELDVLVCTTIIETGVDVSNVNTLIIEDSDRFGLSQLHQLRGRVGRSSRRAYAYMTFKPGRVLTDIAYKRLEAIREFTEFGAGFKIAMRDLEIRGAGNILGARQHGHLDSVGYDMYLKLLSDAVLEEKGEKPATEIECTFDLQINAHIPEKYIESLPQRLGIYRRIADIRNDENKADVLDELIDRFGDPPKSVLGLIELALLRNKAAAAGITEITQRETSMLFYPKTLDLQKASILGAIFKNRVKVTASEKPYIMIKMKQGQTPLDLLNEVLCYFGS